MNDVLKIALGGILTYAALQLIKRNKVNATTPPTTSSTGGTGNDGPPATHQPTDDGMNGTFEDGLFRYGTPNWRDV